MTNETTSQQDANTPKRKRTKQRTKARGNGEGSIYYEKKRKTFVAVLSFYDGVRWQRKKQRCKTQDEAQAVLDVFRRQRKKKTIERDDNLTVAAYLTTWLEEHKSEVKVTTWGGYEEIVRMYLKPEIGHVSLAGLDASDLRAMQRRLAQKGKSPSRIGAVRRVLRAALSDAKRDKLVDDNAAMLVDPPKQGRTDPSFFNDDEVTKILAAARKHRLGGIAALALGTGMRRGEMVGLRLVNLDLGNAVAHVVEQVQRLPHVRDEETKKITERRGLTITEPKSDSSRRSIPLVGFVVDALHEHFTAREAEQTKAGDLWCESGHVFTTKHGEPLDPRNVLRAWYEMLDAAKVPRRKLHAARHTTASMLAGANVPRAFTRDLMGHTDSRTTDRYYVHTTLAQLRTATNTLDRPAVPALPAKSGSSVGAVGEQRAQTPVTLDVPSDDEKHPQ